MGDAQEQTGHELRDDGSRVEVLLSARHFGQGGRPTTSLSVCRGAEGYRRDRLYGSVIALIIFRLLPVIVIISDH